MEKDELIGHASSNDNTSYPTIIPTTAAPSISAFPSLTPTVNISASIIFEEAEIEHETDAITVLLMNVTIIGCLLLAYYVKRYRIYHLPESAGALILGMMIGGIARLATDNLKLFEFVSEF